MIKKLKAKLIVICLLSVGIVLATIITTSYIASIINITYSTDRLINILHDNNGKVDREILEKENISLDTIFQTRYFISYSYKENAIPMEIDLKNSSISIDKAKYLSNRVLNSRFLSRGYISGYRYLEYSTSDGANIIFIDCNRQINNLHFMIASATIISIISLVTIFSLLGLFSNRILRPIIDAHEKQKKFITNASHELKTPLTVITANNELLEMEHGENEYTHTINKQVIKLTNMTNALVMLSKIDEMNTLNDLCEFSVSDATYDIINIYKNILCDVEFTYNIQEKVSYFGNEKLYRDLLTILLDNAKKYSLSYVHISLLKIKNRVHIVLRNDSDKIEKGNLNHYTERFFRADESRASAYSGSGIGLSLAKEIVEIHKGTMKINSPDGKEFIVDILI